jgi:heme oxygenase
MDPTVPAAAPDPYDASAAGLVSRMRARTRDLHREAERSGILRELLQRRADLAGYALLLRNLYPVYLAMEAGLLIHFRARGVRHITVHDLQRRDALASDLGAIVGGDWETRLPVLPAAAVYATRIANAAQRMPGTLIAHAYVRYLGDLSGGQVLRRLVSETLGLGPEALSFYDFGSDRATESRVVTYLAAIDAAGRDLAPRMDVIVEEAAEAFRCNIMVSEAVFQAVSPGA